MTRRLLPLLVGVLWAVPLHAAERVAVLDLRFVDVPPALQQQSDERLRAVLQNLGYVVLSAEEVKRRLEEGGVPPGCTIGPCLVNVGRLLKVERVVVGGVSAMGSSYDLTLTFLETFSGTPLAQVTRRCDVCTFAEIGRAVAVAGAELHRGAQAFFKTHALVEVQSSPTGATVTLDGVPAGRAPLRRLLAPGRHELKLTHPGHGPVTRVMALGPGQRQTVYEVLVPQAAGANAAEPERRETRLYRWLAWSSLGAGVALAGSGATLWALHGSCAGGPH